MPIPAVLTVAMASATTRPTRSSPATANTWKPVSSLRSLVNDLASISRKHKPELLYSATARLFTTFLLHPLDAAKARLQTSRATSKLALRAAYRGAPFAGLVPALLAHAPGGVLAFVLYSRLHTYFSHRRPGLLPASIGAACLADALAALWLAPLEAAKLRVQTHAFPTVLAAFRAGSVWNGLFAQVIRDVPTRALHLVLYEKARALHEKRTGEEIGARDGALSGAVVGALVGVLTTPLDVVKTRVMAQRAPPGSAYQGWLACARKTVQTEGGMALFRGVGQRAVYMGLSVALFSAAYEVARRAWREKGLDVVGRVRFAKKGARKVAFLPARDRYHGVFVDAPRV